MLTLSLLFVMVYGCIGYKIQSQQSSGLLPFDKDATLPLRGVLAVAVMLCHACPHITKDYPLLNEFGLWGTVAISSFFFMSGYGLVFSYNKKGKTYLQGFFSHRFTVLLLPLIIVTMIFQVIRIWEGTFSLLEIPCHLVHGYSLSPNSWYCYAISLFYIIFYLTFKYINDIKKAVAVNWIVVLLYIIVVQKLNWGGYWTASISGLPMGMTWALCEARTKKWILRYPFMTYLIMTSILLIIFIYVNVGFYFHAVPAWGTIICNVTPPFIVYALMYLRFPKWKCLDWLGGISYEFYLLHGVFIYLFTQIYVIDSWLFLPIIFICTLIASQGLMIVDEYIYKFVAMVRKGIASEIQ